MSYYTFIWQGLQTMPSLLADESFESKSHPWEIPSSIKKNQVSLREMLTQDLGQHNEPEMPCTVRCKYIIKGPRRHVKIIYRLLKKLSLAKDRIIWGSTGLEWIETCQILLILWIYIDILKYNWLPCMNNGKIHFLKKCGYKRIIKIYSREVVYGM